MWRQYQEWAATARRRKQVETKARNTALMLGILGAVLGALTGYLAPEVARVVGVAAALVVHAGVDDLKTDPAGNAGDRVACGVVAQ